MFEGKFLRRWAVAATWAVAGATVGSLVADDAPADHAASAYGALGGVLELNEAPAVAYDALGGGDVPASGGPWAGSGASAPGLGGVPGGYFFRRGTLEGLIVAEESPETLPNRIVNQRNELLASLRQLQDAYCRAGMLDAAIAVRDQVRAIEGLEQTALPPIATVVTSGLIPGLAYPGQPAAQNDGRPYELCGRIGETFYTEVTGSTNGSVWGDGVYTCDSDLATAAVHAGVLQEGETAVVQFTMSEGRPEYGSSSKNGVTTSSWASYGGSFRVDAAAPALYSLYQLRDQGKERMDVFVVGDAQGGTVWGGGVYTDDSALAAAAVHDGFLSQGEKGILTVEFLAGQDSYSGSERNGATSRDYGAWTASFRFIGEPKVFGGHGLGESVPTDLAPYDLRGRDGQTFTTTVTGSTGGSIWGDGIYTDDSSLASAAVHAGVLADGETGTVCFTILPGQDSYGSSTQNGVTTSSYGSYGGSFRVDGLDDAESVLSTESRTVTGSTTGIVWGSGVYTSDSDVGTAAVHAGVLSDGETGTIVLQFLPGRDSYTGSESNGVETRDYGSWGGSYRIEGADTSAIEETVLRTETMTVTGSTGGVVWGSGIYTSDSDIGTAAVHAGILEVGETGQVTIEYLPGKESYADSESNGVTTNAYGPWTGSFRFVESLSTEIPGSGSEEDTKSAPRFEESR